MRRTNRQRKLLIVPILHTKEDMGTLGSCLPEKDGYPALVSAFWEEVKEKVKKYTRALKVRVYQDGLPDTEQKLVEKIIKEVKSPNYELLRLLRSRGAKIMGSEDPKLLKEEYRFVSRIVKTQNEKTKKQLKQACESQAAELLAKRDSYIAKRIDKSLKRDELEFSFLVRPTR